MFFTSRQGSCSFCSAGHLPKRATACDWSFELDYIVGGITTVFLFIYLIYALLKPEKF
ncbi:MAG: K(+)-transporting ATPase subunit F [Acidobacteriaceae bacterium]|nr:K(+)-transporting ATPase subunit F [Acidobacteriaceae bacterium]